MPALAQTPRAVDARRSSGAGTAAAAKILHGLRRTTYTAAARQTSPATDHGTSTVRFHTTSPGFSSAWHGVARRLLMSRTVQYEHRFVGNREPLRRREEARGGRVTAKRGWPLTSDEAESPWGACDGSGKRNTRSDRLTRSLLGRGHRRLAHRPGGLERSRHSTEGAWAPSHRKPGQLATRLRHLPTGLLLSVRRDDPCRVSTLHRRTTRRSAYLGASDTAGAMAAPHPSPARGAAT
jgi:hypothetical protein